MKKYFYLLAVLALFMIGTSCGEDTASDQDQDAAADNSTDSSLTAPSAAFISAASWRPGAFKPHGPVCGPSKSNEARCHARVIVDELGNAMAASTPTGYSPQQLLGAYNLTPTASGVPIIGIVDAYDDPNILADLNTYSAYWGIPTMTTCPTSTWPPTAACFRKVNQTGGTSYPRANAGWALEIALDVEIAHAICQNCAIVLVEANSASMSDLMAGVDRARILGAKAISNSYGGGESRTQTSYDSRFNYPGIAFTVSSGDSGYGVEYPASSPYVTAVGGTTLTLSGLNYVSETVWSGAGSGCSAYEPKPDFQTLLGLTGCTKRMVADVSAVADPNTGAAIYDSVNYQGKKGWFQVGGTSLSSPLVAAVYALGGVPTGTKANSMPYSLGNYTTTLHDVTSGRNGTCSVAYLCNAAVGYDGPTGVGTPKGIGAF